MIGRTLIDALLSTLLAPPCAACGNVLDRPLDGAVCAQCWNRITLITPPICDSCGDPLPSWRIASCTARKCPRCRRRQPAVDRVRAMGPYQDELRAIVHALKYDGRRSVARRLGALMRDGGSDVLFGADLVVPVPLHPRRRRQRGFNQAVLLASQLHLPMREVLRRVVHTCPQVELPAARRHKNVRNAFQVVGGARLSEIDGKILVLVDDVITTGATLEACARALKAAGAREVRALTAARVVSAPPPAPDR